MRLQALSIACITAIVLGSCGAEDKSGACTGTMNGAYFRLEIANFLVDTGIDVRINGRFVGKIGKASVNPNDNLIDGTVKRLGEFPVCDKMVIDARGSEGTYTNKLCARPAILSPSCSAPGDPASDFCWFSVYIADDIPCDDCRPFAPAQPSCPCGAGTNPGDAWERC